MKPFRQCFGLLKNDTLTARNITGGNKIYDFHRVMVPIPVSMSKI
ncbi:conserved hypothetical protein [delta proteobacterium NaphS2]|nr:conserved hypothetical protein [delta proteobacterium NaphS2]